MGKKDKEKNLGLRPRSLLFFLPHNILVYHLSAFSRLISCAFVLHILLQWAIYESIMDDYKKYLASEVLSEGKLVSLPILVFCASMIHLRA